MNRTFHHRFTLGSKCGVVLFALLAVYLFWVKWVIAGLLLVVLNVLMIERVLHSEYVFSDDTLTISRGRFAKRTSVPLADIKSCRPITTTFGMSRFLLLEYGNGRFLSVEPEQETAFVQYLQHRLTALAMANADAEEEQG